MSAIHRILIVVALVGAVGAVIVMKQEKPQQEATPEAAALQAAVAVTNAETATPQEAPKHEALPRLVDLGAGKCIPCKMMAPILEDLSKAYADTFDVELIDVWKDPEAGENYDVRVIPTQIFYDAAGKELFRHEGFFGKEDILATWQEFGVVGTTESKE